MYWQLTSSVGYHLINLCFTCRLQTGEAMVAMTQSLYLSILSRKVQQMQVESGGMTSSKSSLRIRAEQIVASTRAF